MTSTDEAKIKEKLKIVMVIYIAMIGSILTYLLLVEIISQNPNFNNNKVEVPWIDNLRNILFGISIAMFFIIKFIRKNLINSALSKTYINVNIGTRQGDVSNNPINNFPVIEIITYALCESVAVFGLVLFFISRNKQHFYILFILSLFYFVLHYPKICRWEEWSSKIKRIA